MYVVGLMAQNILDIIVISWIRKIRVLLLFPIYSQHSLSFYNSFSHNFQSLFIKDFQNPYRLSLKFLSISRSKLWFFFSSLDFWGSDDQFIHTIKLWELNRVRWCHLFLQSHFFCTFNFLCSIFDFIFSFNWISFSGKKATN